MKAVGYCSSQLFGAFKLRVGAEPHKDIIIFCRDTAYFSSAHVPLARQVQNRVCEVTFQAALSLMILCEAKWENTLVGRCGHAVHWDRAVGSGWEKIWE
ncbi:hypothetical protein MC885_001477, partial [Smutsia gigantea]